MGETRGEYAEGDKGDIRTWTGIHFFKERRQHLSRTDLRLTYFFGERTRGYKRGHHRHHLSQTGRRSNQTDHGKAQKGPGGDHSGYRLNGRNPGSLYRRPSTSGGGPDPGHSPGAGSSRGSGGRTAHGRGDPRSG